MNHGPSILEDASILGLAIGLFFIAGHFVLAGIAAVAMRVIEYLEKDA